MPLHRAFVRLSKVTGYENLGKLVTASLSPQVYFHHQFQHCKFKCWLFFLTSSIFEVRESLLTRLVATEAKYVA